MPQTITAPPAPALPNLIKWDADSYENLYSMGLLEHGKYELLEGDIVQKMAIKNAHALIVTLLFSYLLRFCTPRTLRSAFTLAVGVRSEPEPDFAVLFTESPTLTERGYVQPDNVRLVVEVGDSTVASDISTKSAIYAGAGIPEYWVIDVTGRRLLVHTAPVAGAYSSVLEYDETESVAPTFAPTETTPVSALLS
ncbi:MAG: Uma2 family endonuclease [Armatimonadetes bacterium]|nr:Uma2 family endonuclease [Armatimonadota bacterium]